MFQGEPTGRSNFMPRPELEVLDADTTLLFLSGKGVMFEEPSEAYWYEAITPLGKLYGLDFQGSLQVYRPNEEASPMGCVERWQWCNSAVPRNRECGALSSFMDSLYSAAPLFNMSGADLDPARPSTSSPAGRRLIWLALIVSKYPTSLDSLLAILGPKSLDSQTRFGAGIQLRIERYQWQQDVTHWFATILASFQASFVDVVVGNTNPETRPELVTPINTQEQRFCENQVLLMPSWPRDSCISQLSNGT